MKRTISRSVACGLILGAAGCGDLSLDGDTQTVTSALTTTTSDVRGFIRADGKHAVIVRAPDGTITELTGSPPIGQLGNPFTLSSNPSAAGSSPWGFKRSDGADSVLYVDANRHLHEVANPGGVFTDTDFAAAPINAPLVAPSSGSSLPIPDVIGYVRKDKNNANNNINAIVYQNDAHHVIEVSSNFGSSPPWIVSDLTAIFSVPVNVANWSTVFPYVRTDNNNALVYIGSDFHVHELISNFGHTPAWSDGDLNQNSGETQTPFSDLMGYKQGDNVTNAVVYLDIFGNLHELSLKIGAPCSGHAWCTRVITAATSTNPSASNRPFGYVRADSKNAVVYVGNDNGLHEVSRPATGGTWTHGLLPIGSGVAAVGKPFGQTLPIPFDRSSVLFEGFSSFGTNGNELSLAHGGPAWQLQTF